MRHTQDSQRCLQDQEAGPRGEVCGAVTSEHRTQKHTSGTQDERKSQAKCAGRERNGKSEIKIQGAKSLLGVQAAQPQWMQGHYKLYRPDGHCTGQLTTTPAGLGSYCAVLRCAALQMRCAQLR